MKKLSDMTIKELVEYYGNLCANMRSYGANVFDKSYETLEDKARAVMNEADRRDDEWQEFLNNFERVDMWTLLRD